MEEISQISNIVNIPQLYNRKFYYNRKYKISCNLSRNTMNVSLKKFKCFQQKLKMTKYSVVFPKKKQRVLIRMILTSPSIIGHPKKTFIVCCNRTITISLPIEMIR